jgi:DUF4097 and DUF4098 domain-containing protein YvlB
VTTFETPGHVALRVTLSDGAVTVETTEQQKVEIELVALRDSDVTRKAIAEARVEMTERGLGHEVAVHVGKSSGFLIGRGPKVGVRVRCPRGSDLGLRASSADLEATGLLGSVHVKTASGDVALEDVRSLEVDTASGDVRVRDVEGTMGFRTASGDATVSRCGGALTGNLVSGDLSVGEAAAGLSVTTVSGGVRVHAAGGGDIRVQSVSGDVHLAIKPGERLYVDAGSVSGTMSSELGLDDIPSADSSSLVRDVRVRTVSGDLQIVRAAAVEA